jgi:hypothetical protein
LGAKLPIEAEVKRGSHIALVGVFALAIHSFGFCAGVASGCTISKCTGRHQRDGGSCHRHSDHSRQESRHYCCVSPICARGAELTVGKDASVSDVPMPLPVVFSLLSTDLARSPARFVALIHAPPPHVPIFLSIRTLLI